MYASSGLQFLTLSWYYVTLCIQVMRVTRGGGRGSLWLEISKILNSHSKITENMHLTPKTQLSLNWTPTHPGKKFWRRACKQNPRLINSPIVLAVMYHLGCRRYTCTIIYPLPVTRYQPANQTFLTFYNCVLSLVLIQYTWVGESREGEVSVGSGPFTVRVP